MEKKLECSFEGCENVRYGKKNICKGHYNQQWRGEPLRPIRKQRKKKMTDDEMAQFIIDNIDLDQETGCWIWQKAVDSAGYGQIGYQGRLWSVHRLTYKLFVGELIPGMDIDHISCENKRCCSPECIRQIPRAGNAQNRQGLSSNNTSGCEGVSWHKRRGKWQAQICVDGKITYLGIFKEKSDAVKARKDAEPIHHPYRNPEYREPAVV